MGHYMYDDGKCNLLYIYIFQKSQNNIFTKSVITIFHEVVQFKWKRWDAASE